MHSIVAALAQNLIFRIEDRIEETVARSKRNAMFAGAAILLLLTAYVLVIAAICVALASHYGTVPALLGLAGGVATIALVLIAILLYLNNRDAKLRRHRRKQMQARRQLAALAAGTAARQPLATAALGLALALFLKPGARRRRRRND
ncbi:chromate transport protein ChrA [Mycoplana sp. BE70]|uniref:hypothetical protein n=1 Tax=Mycoplana sp. BE70 TaxID=2817775 RepID=UPI002864E99F|nr:hypothetical protein [Mycoplana sp. BE70]MDR6757595.1 chromate transport protein ChrA [Mycoplana sp. BE70]